LNLTFAEEKKSFVIPFDKLGTIIIREGGDGPRIIFKEGTPTTGTDIPQLKVEREERKEIVTKDRREIKPESLEKTVTPEVLEYFRGRESSDMIINFRTGNAVKFNAFYAHVEKGSYESAAELFRAYLDTCLDNNANGLSEEQKKAITE